MSDFEKYMFALAHIKELQSQNMDLFDDNAVLIAENEELKKKVAALETFSRDELKAIRKDELMKSHHKKLRSLDDRIAAQRREIEDLVHRIALMNVSNPPVQITIQSKYNE